MLARAGLPEGLVRIVHGGAEAGVALAESRASTRSSSRARPRSAERSRSACVSREKEVTVELGGKDAMLVLADAHLPRAVDGALWAGCAGAGQARGSVERVYVAREVYEPFLAALVRGARSGCASGDPADDRTQVGPLASEARRRRTSHALVEEAVAAGARSCTAADPSTAPIAAHGRVLRPDGAQRRTGRRCGSMREPVDGPVLCVHAVDSEDEAIALRERQRLQPRRVGLDRRPLPGARASPASCTRGWCG